MTRLRVVGIADTDSYVKWVAALIGGAPSEWDVSLTVLETPLSVSERQLTTALAGSGMDAAAARRSPLAAFEESVASAPPDAVVIGARGPLVRVIARVVALRAPRAVIVTGLPGVAIPATRKALVYRAQCDLFVVHSHRERRAFRAVAAEKGFPQEFALATLPFARRAAAPVDPAAPGGEADGVSPTRGRATDLVFAAQALAPRERADRRRLAALLREAALADPSRRVVLKVRGVRGEQQTHAETAELPDLVAELGPVPDNLVVSAAPMQDALDTAEGLVTISSTAAIEAIARGIPVIALDDFGVSRPLINEVFEGSGLFGDGADVRARRFRHPEPAWVADSYLHDAADDDWAARLADAVRARRAGSRPGRLPLPYRGGALREAWDRRSVLGRYDRSALGLVAAAVGAPLRAAVRIAGRLRGLARPGPDDHRSDPSALGLTTAAVPHDEGGTAVSSGAHTLSGTR